MKSSIIENPIPTKEEFFNIPLDDTPITTNEHNQEVTKSPLPKKQDAFVVEPPSTDTLPDAINKLLFGTNTAGAPNVHDAITALIFSDFFAKHKKVHFGKKSKERELRRGYFTEITSLFVENNIYKCKNPGEIKELVGHIQATLGELIGKDHKLSLSHENFQSNYYEILSNKERSLGRIFANKYAKTILKHLLTKGISEEQYNTHEYKTNFELLALIRIEMSKMLEEVDVFLPQGNSLPQFLESIAISLYESEKKYFIFKEVFGKKRLEINHITFSNFHASLPAFRDLFKHIVNEKLALPQGLDAFTLVAPKEADQLNTIVVRLIGLYIKTGQYSAAETLLKKCVWTSEAKDLLYQNNEFTEGFLYLVANFSTLTPEAKSFFRAIPAPEKVYPLIADAYAKAFKEGENSIAILDTKFNFVRTKPHIDTLYTYPSFHQAIMLLAAGRKFERCVEFLPNTLHESLYTVIGHMLQKSKLTELQLMMDRYVWTEEHLTKLYNNKAFQEGLISVSITPTDTALLDLFPAITPSHLLYNSIGNALFKWSEEGSKAIIGFLLKKSGIDAVEDVYGWTRDQEKALYNTDIFQKGLFRAISHERYALLELLPPVPPSSGIYKMIGDALYQTDPQASKAIINFLERKSGINVQYESALYENNHFAQAFLQQIVPSLFSPPQYWNEITELFIPKQRTKMFDPYFYRMVSDSAPSKLTLLHDAYFPDQQSIDALFDDKQFCKALCAAVREQKQEIFLMFKPPRINDTVKTMLSEALIEERGDMVHFFLSHYTWQPEEIMQTVHVRDFANDTIKPLLFDALTKKGREDMVRLLLSYYTWQPDEITEAFKHAKQPNASPKVQRVLLAAIGNRLDYEEELDALDAPTIASDKTFTHLETTLSRFLLTITPLSIAKCREHVSALVPLLEKENVDISSLEKAIEALLPLFIRDKDQAQGVPLCFRQLFDVQHAMNTSTETLVEGCKEMAASWEKSLPPRPSSPVNELLHACTNFIAQVPEERKATEPQKHTTTIQLLQRQDSVKSITGIS